MIQQTFDILTTALRCTIFFFLFQACAPRYIYYVFMNRMDPVGMCFTAKGVGNRTLTQTRPFRPCVEQGNVTFLRDLTNIFVSPLSL